MQRNKVLAGILIFGATAFGADPRLLNLVMPDAKVLSGVNVTNAKTSPFGQFLIAQFQAKDGGLPKILATAGFDPFTDVNEILAASAADPAKPGILVALTGTFKVPQIAAAVAGNKNITVETYDGATLVTFTAPKSSSAMAFLGSSIAVAGDSAAVKAALDRNSSANSINPALAAQVNNLSASEDAWLVSSASVDSLLPASVASGIPPQAAPILSNIQGFSGGVKFGDNTRIMSQLVVNTPQNADALASVVKLLASLVSMNSDKPGAAPKNPQISVLLPLLKGLQVAADGNDVNLALTIPEAQLETLVGNHAGN